MKRIATAILLMAAGWCLCAPAADDAVAIIVDRADASIFPESWRQESISAKAEPLPEAERGPCGDLVAAELQKYPAGMLKKNLQRVHVLARLEYRGVATGGTRSANVVYLVRNEKISSALLANNLHAEFSSILVRNHRAALEEGLWHECNPPGFEYRGSGVQAVKAGQASTKLSDDLHVEGFLNEYAKASLEEDFNSFAGRLFTGDPGLWRAVERFPAIAEKTELAIAFYTSLHPTLDRAFFEGLRQER